MLKDKVDKAILDASLVLSHSNCYGYGYRICWIPIMMIKAILATGQMLRSTNVNIQSRSIVTKLESGLILRNQGI